MSVKLANVVYLDQNLCKWKNKSNHTFTIHLLKLKRITENQLYENV